MIDINNSVLVLIDIQERLVGMLNKQEPIKKNSSILMNIADMLDIPVILTEQYPAGLGKTISEISYDLTQERVIEKTSFSAMQTEEFVKSLEETGRKTVIICGIETHICVYQTAIELLDAGYEVIVVKDACASRSTECFKIGIQRMKDEGAKIYNTEMVLFELLKSSKHPKFREAQLLIK